MGLIQVCPECGRKFDRDHHAKGHTAYCSDGCLRKAQAAGSTFGGPKAHGTLGKAQGAKPIPLYLIIPAIGIILLIGIIGLAVNGIRNAVSDTKIEVVSASCDTQEKFVSIIEKALSGVSASVIEGEEFTTYAYQARDAIKKREGKYAAAFKDSVYFVKLPGSVNVYIWFETEDVTTAYVYKVK
jgi:hypothetical protein